MDKVWPHVVPRWWSGGKYLVLELLLIKNENNLFQNKHCLQIKIRIGQKKNSDLIYSISHWVIFYNHIFNNCFVVRLPTTPYFGELPQHCKKMQQDQPNKFQQVHLPHPIPGIYEKCMSLLFLKSKTSRQTSSAKRVIHIYRRCTERVSCSLFAQLRLCFHHNCCHSLRCQFIFTEPSSWLCHCQFLHKSLYGSHMYLDPSALDYACQQMEHATWFSAFLHSSKTGLMTYHGMLRGDKWHCSCMGGKRKICSLLYGVQVTCLGACAHYTCLWRTEIAGYINRGRQGHYSLSVSCDGALYST